MEHKDLLRDNRFLVYIENKKYTFQKVSGITTQFHREIYNEGGVAEPHFLAAKQTDMNTLRLEKGVTKSQEGSLLNRKMQPGMMMKNIQIIVLDKYRSPSREYYIENALITKFELADFDAMGENVLIEKLELEYYKIS